MECTGPELDVQVCTQEECAHGVGQSAMAALNRAILTRVVGPSGMNGVALFGEQVLNFWMVEELSTLIKMHTLVGAGGIALAWEVGKPFQRRAFGDASVAMFHASEVISDKDPTSLSVCPCMIFAAFGIF